MTSFFDYFIGYTVSLNVEAQDRMHELDTFEGGNGLVFSATEPKRGHIAWTNGTNSATGSRSLRIAVPLAMAVEILQKADLKIFTQEGGVECWPGQLQYLHHQVWFLNWKWEPFHITDVQRELPQADRKIHCKSIELPLNFHQRMVRYSFRVPSRHEWNTKGEKRTLDETEWQRKCGRYLEKWIDLIIAEKKRQMHSSGEMWPPWNVWTMWTMRDVWTMPTVLWLSKPKPPKKRKAHQ